MKFSKIAAIGILSLLAVPSSSVFAGGKDQRQPQTEQAGQQETEGEKNAKDFADQKYPLSDDDVRAVKKKLDGLRRAFDEPVNYPPPRPVTSTITIDLAPGATPPLVRPARREGSTISFIDTTGKPWPIFNHINHAGDLFEVSRPIPNGHIMCVTPQGNYGQGNITVLLKDLETPVVMTLVLGQPEADYRIDAKIPMMGPNSEPAAQRKNGSSSMAVGDFDQTLHSFLDDLAPATAKKVKITGVHQTKGWALDDKLYVRSSLQPISPAYRDRLMGTGNVGVYVFEPTPMLLFSDNGRIVKALVEWGD